MASPLVAKQRRLAVKAVTSQMCAVVASVTSAPAADKMAARGEDREAPDAPSPPPPGPGGGVNVFANDGSFLELFKRKMEAEEQQREREAAAGGTGGTGGGTGTGTGSQRGGDGAKRSGGGALGFVRSEGERGGMGEAGPVPGEAGERGRFPLGTPKS